MIIIVKTGDVRAGGTAGLAVRATTWPSAWARARRTRCACAAPSLRLPPSSHTPTVSASLRCPGQAGPGARGTGPGTAWRAATSWLTAPPHSWRTTPRELSPTSTTPCGPRPTRPSPPSWGEISHLGLTNNSKQLNYSELESNTRCDWKWRGPSLKTDSSAQAAISPLK